MRTVKPKAPVAASPPKVKLPPASSPPIALEVLGSPAPKGSSQAFAFAKPGGGMGARVVPGGSKGTRERIIGWDGAVRDAALTAIGVRVSPPFVATALDVEIEFRLARPAGHYGTGRNAGEIKSSAPVFPFGKPDVDKLARTTLDAMTGAIFDDDSRIARLTVSKIFAAPGRSGAWIRVASMGPRLVVLDEDRHERACPCGICQDERERVAALGAVNRSAPVITAAGPSPSTARIRKILEGTTVAADSALLATGRRQSHALAKHAPTVELDAAIGRLVDLEDDFGGPDL